MVYVRAVEAAPRNQRVSRSPDHTFYVAPRPYQIQPCCIAPVLPGETMDNALLQARVVTDPITNKLVGWWLEFFLWYVKFTDLDERDSVTAMLLDPSYDIASAGLTSTSSQYREHFYASANRPAINWTRLCLKRVTEEYFRNEGEAWDAYTLDGLPVAGFMQRNWLDSAGLDDTRVSYDLNVDLDSDTAVEASEIEEAMRRYELARTQGLTEMSYEDWLGTYGVRPAPEVAHRPELVRYVKDWQYPSNTINSSNGVATSAVSWSIAERADKARFFKEPGFLFGAMVARPKVYMENIKGSMVQLMRDQRSWLPALLNDDPDAGFVKAEYNVTDLASDYPLDVVTDTNGAWADVRDLLMYGDQFVGLNMGTDTGYSEVAYPTTDLANKRYLVSTTEADALFSGTNKKVRADGVWNFNIRGRQTDRSPTVTARV